MAGVETHGIGFHQYFPQLRGILERWTHGDDDLGFAHGEGLSIHKYSTGFSTAQVFEPASAILIRALH
jgi:hypothetical protein